MSNGQKEHDLWNLSENLRATADVLVHLRFRASAYAKDLCKVTVLLQLTNGLLANIESLIEAAQAVQYISRPITQEVLTASVGLRDKMLQYRADLIKCIEGSESDIGVNRPSTIYNRSYPYLKRIEQNYCKILGNLRNKVKAESLMQTEEPTEVGQENGIEIKPGKTKDLISSIQEIRNHLKEWMDTKSANNDLGCAVDAANLRGPLVRFDNTIASFRDYISEYQYRETREALKALQGYFETNPNMITLQEILKLAMKFEKQLELCQTEIISDSQKPAGTGEGSREVETKDERPKDLMDLAKAVGLYHRSRSQIKRDIENGNITDYRMTERGKHWISKKEADIFYISK